MARSTARSVGLLTSCGAGAEVAIALIWTRVTHTPPAPPPRNAPTVSPAPEAAPSLVTTAPTTRAAGPSWAEDDPFPEAVRIRRPLGPEEARRVGQSRLTLNVRQA